MNILPLVAIFLIIFSLFSHRVIQSYKSFSLEKHSYIGLLEAELDGRNILEKENYETLRDKSYHPKSDEKEKQPSIDTKNTKIHEWERKDFETLAPLGKFNLFHFLFAEKVSPVMKASIIKLFHRLYDNTDFIKEFTGKRFMENLLDGLRKNARASLKNNPDLLENIKLEDIYPLYKFEQDIYYKMLSGTTIYDLEENIGFPPLGHFFTLHEETQEKLFYFPSTTVYHLDAFFGPEITQKILEKDHEKKEENGSKSRLTKKELREIIQQTRNFRIEADEIEKMLYFSHAPKNRAVVGKSKQGNIKRVRRSAWEKED